MEPEEAFRDMGRAAGFDRVAVGQVGSAVAQAFVTGVRIPRGNRMLVTEFPSFEICGMALASEATQDTYSKLKRTEGVARRAVATS